MADNVTLLERAQITINEQQAAIEKLTGEMWQLATVLDINKETVVVGSSSMAAMEVLRTRIPLGIEIGQTVRINTQTGSVTGSSPFKLYGSAGTVAKKDGKLIQITAASGETVNTEYTKVDVEVGDLVLMDSTNYVILAKMKKESEHVFRSATNISWSDIGGLSEAKKELIESLELPFKHPKIFEHYNKKPSKGFLLHGLPGNGKTLLGKAAATALAKVHGKSGLSSGFIYVKGPELLSQWVGVAEQAVRQLFDHARQHKKDHGYPAIIFIDEADALLSKRGINSAAHMEHTIVPQFLSEMDGLVDSCAIVMLATNRADTLDPAVIRPGRIDRKIYVAPPNLETGLEVFKIHLGNLPVAKDTTLMELAVKANAELFNGNRPLYNVTTDKGQEVFGLSHIVSGAMIAGIIEQATSFAIHRDIASGKRGGLAWEDFSNSFDAVYKQQRHLDHTAEIKEFTEARGAKVRGIQPCHGGAHAAA